jgi:acetyl-CoA carboxylase carboxyltransferase component
MGLEGAVRLGYRRELDALTDPAEKQALYNRLLAEYYEQGKAIQVASTLEIDAVIDPVDTRRWVLAGLRTVKLRPPLSGRKRLMVDAW